MTPAQVRTAALAVRGFSSRQIAQHLHTTENSVRQTLHRVYRQIGVATAPRQRPDPRILEAALHLTAAVLSLKQK